MSDYDTRSTGQFQTILFNMMDTDLKFSTIIYTQTKGQIERMKHLLKEYLTHYVTKSQWY